MGKRGLSELIGRQEFQRLAGANWPLQHFVSRGHSQRLRALSEIPALKRPEVLFSLWPDRARAWSPLSSKQPVLQLPADQLLTAYKAGHTIYLTNVERYVRELIPWIRGIERELGLCRSDVTCEILCSNSGQGAKMHFDPNMTLNFQLRGKKKWKVAANQCVTNPHNGGALDDEIPSDLRGYLKRPFPKAMPASADTFETKAGDLVFLPHGCWHSTECSEPSMALLFTISGNHWHTLLAKEVETALRAHEVCRTMALVSPPGKVQRETSRRQLQQSIELLKTFVNGLDADELLRKWAGPPLTSFRKKKSADTKKKKPDPTAAQDKELLDWMDRQGGLFHAFDLVEEFPTLSPEAALKKLWNMEAQGLLEAK